METHFSVFNNNVVLLFLEFSDENQLFYSWY